MKEFLEERYGRHLGGMVYRAIDPLIIIGTLLFLLAMWEYR